MKKGVFFLLLAAMLMPLAIKAQVNSSVHIDSTISACDTYTWSANNQTYTTSGVRTHVSGDTLYILDLTIYNSVTNVISTPVNGGCTYTWGDSLYTSNGTYTQTFKTTNNCDSTVTITLNLSGTAARTYTVTACERYIFKGDTLTTSGVSIINDTTNPLCDSVLTLDLTVNTPYLKSYDTSITECELALWHWNTDMADMKIYRDTVINSEVFSQSTAATRRLFHPRTAEKCFDSLVTVTFNIKKNGIYNYAHTECDFYSFMINDSTVENFSYSRIDTTKYSRMAANGCDTLIILNITIHTSPIVTITGDLRVTPGSNATLHAESDQTLAYTWHNGSHEESITINNVTENVDVFVRGVNNNTGCEHTSYVTIMANEGINDVETAGITIYPNPTSANININSDDVKNVTVFNMNGQQVLNAGNTNTVDLSAMAKGTYVVRIEMNNGAVATRTVILSK